MIFFYGAGARVLNEIHLPEERPEGVGEEGVVLAVMSRYIHLFWIPLISIGKKVVAIDVLTEEEIKKRNFTKRMKEEAAVLKETSRVPLRHFSGLAIVLLSVLVLLGRDKIKHIALQKELRKPLIGDIYFMKDEDREYPFYFARNVGAVNDAIMIEVSNAGYDLKGMLYEEYSDKAYLSGGFFSGSTMYSFDQATIDSLLDAGVIIDVMRDRDYVSRFKTLEDMEE